MKCMHCGADPKEGESRDDFMAEHPKVCPKHDNISVAEAAENWLRWKKGEDPWADPKNPDQ